jgi:hypothetical protein
MVHLERKAAAEVKGSLEMQQEALAFTDAAGKVTTIPFGQALGARRIHGSPVLVVTWMKEGRRAKTAFYFAKPPPLVPPERQERATGPEMVWLGRTQRGGRKRQRRENFGYLSVSSSSLKPLLKSWARETSDRIRNARESR